ncbi:hypothetical protein MBLNU459_g5429t3 [Dothideomycetes sp. NU459]
MANTPDVFTIITGMTSDADSARKLAAYHLQSLLVDSSFADAFAQADGLPILRRLVLGEHGNALAYSLGSLTRLMDMDLGWEEGTSPEVIERAVQLVISRPVINVLRNALHLLVLIVSRSIDQLGSARPTTPGSTKSFGFQSLMPTLQSHESFLDCLVEKLGSADHALCANALRLINALMRDSIINGGEEEWPKFIKRLQELGVIGSVEALMRGEALRDLANPVLEFQSLTKVLLARWRDVRVDIEIPEHRRALRQLHASSFPSDYQRSGSSRSQNAQFKTAKSSEHARDKWRRLGFTSESPADDFVQAGFLGLMDLTEYVRTNLGTYQTLLLEQSVFSVEQRCPIAQASLSVTSMLYDYFDVDSIMSANTSHDKDADHTYDVEALVQPLLLLWARIHTATLNAFLRLWHEASASQQEFQKVEDLVRLLIRNILGTAGRRSSTDDVESEFNHVSLKMARQSQLAELNEDYNYVWGVGLRKVHDQVHAEALQFMREQRIRCLLEGSWFPVLSDETRISDDGPPTKHTDRPLISSWRFVRVSQDRKWLHCASHLRKSDREPPPHELTRKLDLNTISSVDSSISKCRVPADWEMQRPVSEKDTANQQNQAAKAITKLTIYGSKAGSPTLRAGDEEEETILLELNTASSSLASEWLDGLLMLLNQQPITADTNKLMDVLESWTVNARMLNLQWEDVDWVQAGTGEQKPVPSRDGLDSNFCLRTASWPPDDILYQEDLGSSTSPTRFYHDPDARAKLRQYIATPQDFDEALAERETTFRMTLTRPGLRSMNELRRWQQQDSSRSESNPDEDSDPLALEPLPFSDDTNGAQGHFAASDPEGKGIRKVWKLLNRRSSAASRSS